MSAYVKRFPALRGGWDTDAETYKSLGFTIGLPPNIYVPQTQPITELSQRFESCDSLFTSIDSNFSVQERQFLFQSGHSVRCYVRDIPKDVDEEMLKRIINQRMYQMKLTSSQESVEKVTINPNGQFAFVDFTKAKDAERFIELRDSFEINGQNVHIRRSHNTDSGVTEVPQERQNSLIIWNLDPAMTEADLSDAVSQFAKVSIVEIPRKNGVSLGYGIVDLEDSSLTDIVALKMKHILGADCRRCFPRVGAFPRNQIAQEDADDMKHYTTRETKLYTTLCDGAKDFTVADALNLDISITKLASKFELDRELKRLKMFNLIRTSNPDEITEVVEDVRDQLCTFGRPVSVFADVVSTNQTVECLGVPVVAVYGTAEEASEAQMKIAGRKYKGRCIITMLSN